MRRVCLIIFAAAVVALAFQISAVGTSEPRVSFRCAQTTPNPSLLLKVRNNGPDRLNAGTTIYYFYRTPQSDMSITGSHRLAARLEKGGIFTIDVGGNPQTEITECGCGLRPFTPTARTTRKAP